MRVPFCERAGDKPPHRASLCFAGRRMFVTHAARACSPAAGYASSKNAVGVITVDAMGACCSACLRRRRQALSADAAASCAAAGINRHSRHDRVRGCPIIVAGDNQRRQQDSSGVVGLVKAQASSRPAHTSLLAACTLIIRPSGIAQPRCLSRRPPASIVRRHRNAVSDRASSAPRCGIGARRMLAHRRKNGSQLFCRAQPAENSCGRSAGFQASPPADSASSSPTGATCAADLLFKTLKDRDVHAAPRRDRRAGMAKRPQQLMAR